MGLKCEKTAQYTNFSNLITKQSQLSYIALFWYISSLHTYVLVQNKQMSTTMSDNANFKNFKNLEFKKYSDRYLFCLVYQIKIQNRLYGVTSFSIFFTIWHLIWKIILYTSDEIISKGVNIIWVLHVVMSKSLLFKKTFLLFLQNRFSFLQRSQGICV